MTRRRRVIVAIGSGVLTIVLGAGALGGLALASDGGLMERMMGHDGYAVMVDRMRAVLGSERADQRIASCETAMSAGDQRMTGQMMSGMGSMMGSR